MGVKETLAEVSESGSPGSQGRRWNLVVLVLNPSSAVGGSYDWGQVKSPP